MIQDFGLPSQIYGMQYAGSWYLTDLHSVTILSEKLEIIQLNY